MTTAPSSFHQWVISQLYDMLGGPAKRQGVAYPYFAPIGVLMPGCDPVQPDFVLVRRENAAIIHDRRIRGVPDLIVEVLSPGSAAYDLDVKLTAYARAGVPEYGIIDLAARTVRLYALAGAGQYGPPREFAEGQAVAFACAPSIEVPVSELFVGAPDTTL
jgi:Uma2 family endonuclease